MRPEQRNGQNIWRSKNLNVPLHNKYDKKYDRSEYSPKEESSIAIVHEQWNFLEDYVFMYGCFGYTTGLNSIKI